MAIVQISRITNRKGLQENLPQLAGAELGWSIDQRRLFIGNGTLQEGAPVIGNTEILTEFSDILEFQTTYTYKGEAAGYVVQTGPDAGNPVKQSLQSWLDQFATIKDFGATGDGVTDDTAAINNALYQLFCREVNPQIRRSLFFPAGVYRVTSTIFIPPYATLWGEGVNGSVIQLDNISADSTLNSFVARTCDSLQQYGANIGANGAIPPTDITISNIGFRNLDPTTDIFLVEDATNCRFESVGFYGPWTTAGLDTENSDVAGVRFASTVSLVTGQIVFDDCQFSGTTFGLSNATAISGTDQQVRGITVQNSNFNTLYQGVRIGSETPIDGGASGFRIVGNKFDIIYAEGVFIGSSATLNATGHNIFYNVGNHFGAITNPYTACIDIQCANNVSISDMFARPDAYSIIEQGGTSWPRITLNNTTSIATTNGNQLALGTYVIQSGQEFTLLPAQASPQPIFTINSTAVQAFVMNYTIIRQDTRRTGAMTVTTDNVYFAPAFSDEWTENVGTGITLSISQSGDILTVTYRSNAGISGILTYSITHLA